MSHGLPLRLCRVEGGRVCGLAGERAVIGEAVEVGVSV